MKIRFFVLRCAFDVLLLTGNFWALYFFRLAEDFHKILEL